MTKEEAIKVIEDGDWWDSYITESTIEGINADDELHEALDLALAALRPVSRERVERATWITTNDNGCPMYACSACGARDAKGLYEYSNPRLFCYHCGLPMTDEAVDIVMRRLEALREAIHNS